MSRVFGADDDLRDAVFRDADLSGAVFRETDLTGVRMHGVLLVDVELSGLVQGLVVNEVEVGTLIEDELDRRHPERVWLRAGDPDGLRRGWSLLEQLWADTVERIGRLPEEQRQRRVDGEWSAVETLRHLVFVIDSWFSHEVLRADHPFHPWGKGPDFVPALEAMGIDRDASPTFDEVLAVRLDRQATIRNWLATATSDDLERTTAPLTRQTTP
jgi:uncharacterized protein YjbI with pentapeptide repeats